MKKTISIFSVFLSVIIFAGCSENAPMQENQNTQTEQKETASQVSEESSSEEVVLEDGLYVLNTEESELLWMGTKIGSSHEGTIDIISGDMDFMENQLMSGLFTIDMTSINTTDLEGERKTQMDDHLKSEDFFHVAEYPEAVFMVSAIRDLGSNMWSVDGDLMIKDISNPVTFEVVIQNIAPDKVQMVGDFMIDRTLWDVRYGSDKFFDNLGDKMISNDIQFSLQLVLDRQ